MKWTYSCPHCKAMLNPQDAIILIARRENQVWMIGLHPEPGRYDIFVPPGVDVIPGDQWTFSCPVCTKELTTDFSDALCAVDIHTDHEDHRIFFSRIAGEHATFVVSADGIHAELGKDVDAFVKETAQMKYLL